VVTVWVSNGVAPNVTLPNVVGSTLDAARTTLESLHVFVTVVQRPVTRPGKDGIVFNMDPAAGSDVKEGSSVTLVVGVFSGPSGSPSPSPSPSPGPGNGNGNGGGGGGH
jgi:beta-lactam-binding protein with PASTA domain